MKKILILQAEKTGNGHKSAANAIEKKMKPLGYETKQLNCFTTMGKLGESWENAYIPLTTKHPFLWKIAHGFSQIFTGPTHWFIYQKCKKQMLKEILDFKPDLIVSVHCMFTKAISKLLKKNHLNIPFVIDVVDLINPPKVWMDKRADLTLLPTDEAKKYYLKRGFEEQKLVVSGFPIRETIVRPTTPKKIVDTVNILMVNPSISENKNLKFMTESAKIENSKITIVCGQDKLMYEKLSQNAIGLKNVTVLGYVTNMDELLAQAHILLTKAGPTMLLEGAKSGTAVVVTGHIPGQEAKNYEYITKNGYGIKCENPKKLYSILNDIIKTGKLQTYLNNTLHSISNDGANIIADELNKFLK